MLGPESTSNQCYAPAATLALLSGSSAAIARSLAPGAQAWLACQEQGRRAELDAPSGADAVGRALERLGPASPVLESALSGPGFCWAEISRLSETCLVRCAMDGTGLIRDLVLLRAPVVPSPRVCDPRTVPPGRLTIERYFDDLMNARFEDAAAHFTSDAIYSHPPYSANAEWVLFRGRAALLQGWLTLRGHSPARQVVSGFWQTGERFFMEGVVEGVPNGGSFFSTGQLSARGEIARYIAFYSALRIPGLTGLLK